MVAFIVLLLVCLFAAVAVASYQLSEAKRWRASAEELRAEALAQREEYENAKLIAQDKEGESERARQAAEMQVSFLTRAHQQLEDRFKALAGDALQRNSQLFLDRSRDQLRQMIDPVSQSLHRFEEQVQAVERSRIGAYAELTAQVQTLTHLQERVRQSTEQLKTALRSPIQRGRWGEMQLRRVVELAGMLEY